MTVGLLLCLLAAPAPPPLITIDDGPDHRYHRRTLQLLQRHKVKAIWFVNGHFLRNRKNRKLLRQILQSGHTIGNHTWSHRSPCKLTRRQFRVELYRTERIVNRTLKRSRKTRMRLYRPPFGHRCHLAEARRLGYRVMFWHRADIGSSAASMIRSVRLRHRPRPKPRRSILLFHRHNRKLRAVLRAFYPHLKRSRSAIPRL